MISGGGGGGGGGVTTSCIKPESKQGTKGQVSCNSFGTSLPYSIQVPKEIKEVNPLR